MTPTIRPSILHASVLLNIAMACVVFYLWKTSTPNNDAIHALVTKNNEAMISLNKQIKDLNDQRDLAFKEYQKAVEESIKDYKNKIEELEKKKTATAKGIVDNYKDDLPGLAQKFSETMGLKAK